MRRANVLYKGIMTGIIAETEQGYSFQYNSSYLQNSAAKAVSLTLPLRPRAYKSKILFPFFDGLIPEKWLIDIATDIMKLDQHNRFDLLLKLCKDCIGCISIEAIKE